MFIESHQMSGLDGRGHLMLCSLVRFPQEPIFWSLPLSTTDMSPFLLRCLQFYFSGLKSQSTQSAGPVRFMIFCSISIFLLASLVTGKRPRRNSSAQQQGMYSIIPIHWNIKSAPASLSRRRVGPALYVFSLLG